MFSPFVKRTPPPKIKGGVFFVCLKRRDGKFEIRASRRNGYGLAVSMMTVPTTEPDGGASCASSVVIKRPKSGNAVSV